MNRHLLAAVCSALMVMVCTETLSAQQIIRRPISEDTVIDGIPCAKTTRAHAEFYGSGRLAECPLSRDAVVSSASLPRGTWVVFREDGQLDGAWLPQNHVLSGHVCRGEGYRKWSVRFHPDGALKLCFLPETTTIEGVPCLHGTFWNELRGGGNTAVHFHTNGWLARCQVARASTVDGRQYKKWEVVVRDSSIGFR
jgi:hypothetical protein